MHPLHACLLAQRGIIRLGGVDRRAFLQGLVSNDVALCVPGKPIYAALLTPQGKFLHDLFLYDLGNEFLIDAEVDRLDDLIQRLTAYKLRSKVVMTNAAADFDIWALWRDNESVPQDLNATSMPDPRHPDLGIRVLMPKGVSPNGVHLADFSDYDRRRIRLAVPDGSRDMEVGQSTLLDGNFDRLNGISWTKGCYVGQELTARMHYRALIKKRLYPVKITGSPAVIGMAVMLGGMEVGEMRSSCDDIGLALLKCDVAEAKDCAPTMTSGLSMLEILAK